MLIDQILTGGVWTNSVVRSTGPLLLSVDGGYSADMIPDVYTLTVSNKSGFLATITVDTLSKTNPFKGRVINNVDLRYGFNYTIIQGVDCEFDSAAANGATSTVFVGLFGGTLDASVAAAGNPSAPVRHKVVNDGENAVVQCKARLMTGVTIIKKTGYGLIVVKQVAESATEKSEAGTGRIQPYAFSFSNVSGSGAERTADLSIDGVAVSNPIIRDLTLDTLVTGADLRAITYGTPYPYRIESGPLTDVEFVVHELVADGDVTNVLVFPTRFIQIAEDNAGVAGAFGVSDVVLTEAEATGEIAAGGAAYYWSRFNVPLGSNAKSNPYPCNIVIEGEEDELYSADWGG